MVLSWRTYFLLLFVFCMNLMDMTESCEEDEQCKPHQVCCGKRCRSWPKCFLNSDKECYYDTHCVQGEYCLSNVCIRKKTELAICASDRDCIDDTDRSVTKCCRRRCLPATNCTELLEINSTLNSQTTASSALSNSCLGTANCPRGLECLHGTCTLLEKQNVSRSQNNDETEDSGSTAMSTGLLSAALFSGAVLLTFACFCFLRETKFYRAICYENQSRNSQTLPTCSRHHSTADFNYPPFNPDGYPNASRMLFPGVHAAHQFRNDNHDDDVSPPAYRSVCFNRDLVPPPTYDQAVNQCKH